MRRKKLFKSLKREKIRFIYIFLNIRQGKNNLIKLGPSNKVVFCQMNFYEF